MMKVPPILAALIALCFSVASAGAIDFNPRFSDSIEDGVPMHRMYFSDGVQRIYYRPFPGWEAAASEDAITFTTKAPAVGHIRFQNGDPGSAAIPLEGAGLETLREIADSMAPAGSTGAEKAWEKLNPVILHGWTSFEIAFDHQVSGATLRRSILFLNLDAERQILLIVDSDVKKFEAVHKLAHRSLATWWEP